MRELEILIANASEDELRVITRVLGRANTKPAILVTVRDSKRYVVAQEDEPMFEALVGLSEAELATRVSQSLGGFGAQWLRGYGRVDEMYRSLTLREVVKVAEVDRERVWGRR